MAIEDRVSIVLSGKELRICEGYDVQIGLLTQPSRFALRIGHPGLISDLLKLCVPNSPCEIRVTTAAGAPLQFKGTVDARRGSGPEATLEVRGRDALSKLWDSYADADASYVGLNYHELVVAVLKAAGYANPTLVDSHSADVITKTGFGLAPNTIHVQESGSVKNRVTKTMSQPPTIRIGERHYDFLKRILDRAALFLMAGADGSIILTQPDPFADPLYRVVNKRQSTLTGPVAPGTVVNFDFDQDASNRFSRAVVCGRSTKERFGATKVREEFVDDEMTSWGFDSPRGFIDSNVVTLEDATFYARRRVADARRQGFFLSYTLAGHTTPALNGGKPIVWSRCTTVQVEDEELGLDGIYFVDHVALVGSPEETHTLIRLIRPADVVFGDLNDTGL